MSDVRSKRWTFTTNPSGFLPPNEPEETNTARANRTINQWLRTTSREYKITFLVCQLEKATTETEHIQGYLETNKRISMATLRRTVCSKSHWERALGTAEDNIKYCSKDETCVSPSSRMCVGQPSTKVDWLERLKAGESMADILKDMQQSELYMVQSLVAAVRILQKPQRKHQTQCIILQGKGGVGKSTLAREFAVQRNLTYYHKAANRWWQGYNGEEVVIFDEFKGHMSITEFKQMINHSAWQVEYKGGSTPFLAELVIICTNWDPTQWWDTTDRADEEAIIRRMNPPIGSRYKLESLQDTRKLYKKWGINEPRKRAPWEDSNSHSEIDEVPWALKETIKRTVDHDRNTFAVRDIPIPDATWYYNKYMGGVDKSDQYLSYHAVL